MRKIAKDYQDAKQRKGFAGDAGKRQKLQEEAQEIGYEFGMDRQKTGKLNKTFIRGGYKPDKILEGVESRYAKIAQKEAERGLIKSGEAAVGPAGQFRGKIDPRTGMIIGKETGADRDKALKVYDAKSNYGLLGLYGVKSTDKGYAEAPIEEISKLSKINELFKNPANKRAGKHKRQNFGKVGFKK